MLPRSFQKSPLSRHACCTCALALLLAAGCDAEPFDTGYEVAAPEGCDRASPYDLDALTADVEYLASPALDGRAPGSRGDRQARAFVAERFACLGLETVPGGQGYQHPFVDADGNETANVLARVSGGALGDEVVVVTAHLDHFGDGRLGANDNASGVAALLAMAQEAVQREAPARSVVFAVVGSEESGFEGSEALMSAPPAGFDPDAVVYNVNLDMVGSFTQTGVVYALGAFAGSPGRRAVAELAGDLAVEAGYGSDQSDNVSFCERGIPYVFFWTEDLDCYHERCDVADNVDFDSLSAVADLAGGTVLALADSASDLAGDVQPRRDVCDTP